MKFAIAGLLTLAVVDSTTGLNHDNLVYRNLQGLKYPGAPHEADPASGSSFRRELAHEFSHNTVDTTIDLSYELEMHEHHLALAHARHVQSIRCLQSDGKVVALDIQLVDTSDEEVSHQWWNKMYLYSSISGTCFHVDATTFKPIVDGVAPFYASFSNVPILNKSSESMFIHNVVERSPDHCFKKIKMDLKVRPSGNPAHAHDEEHNDRNLQGAISGVFGPLTELAKQITNFAQVVPECDLTGADGVAFKGHRRRLGWFDNLWNGLKDKFKDLKSPNFDVDCNLNPSVNLNYDVKNKRALVQQIPFTQVIDASKPINPNIELKGAACDNCYFHATVGFFLNLEFENFIPKKFEAGMEASAAGNLNIKMKGTVKGNSGLNQVLPPTEILRFAFSLGPVPITVNLGVGLSAGTDANENTDAEFEVGASFDTSYSAKITYLVGQQNVWKPTIVAKPPTYQVKKPTWTLDDNIDLQMNATFSPDVVIAFWGAVPIHLALRPKIGLNVGPSAVPYTPTDGEDALPTFTEACQVPFSSDWGVFLGMKLGDVSLPAGVKSIPKGLGLEEIVNSLDNLDLGSMSIVEDRPLPCKYCNGCYKEYKQAIKDEEIASGLAGGNLGTIGAIVGGSVGAVALATVAGFVVYNRRAGANANTLPSSRSTGMRSMFKSSKGGDVHTQKLESSQFSDNPLFNSKF